MASVQFLIDEPSCQPRHREVAAAAFGLLVAADLCGAARPAGATARLGASVLGDGAPAPPAQCTGAPLVTWRYALSSEPHRKTPLVPFSMHQFQAFAACVAGSGRSSSGSSSSGRSDSGRSTSGTSHPYPSSSSPASNYSLKRLTRDVLQALQFVAEPFGTVPDNVSENSRENGAQAACVIVAVCPDPLDHENDRATCEVELAALGEALKRRRAILLIVDTVTPADAPAGPADIAAPASRSRRSGVETHESGVFAAACEAACVSCVSLGDLAQALRFLPPSLCVPPLCPLVFPGLFAAQARLALRTPPPPRDNTADSTSDGTTTDSAAAAPALATTQVYLARPIDASDRFSSGADEDGISERDSSGVVWLGAGLLAPWLNDTSPCGCPPPAALLVHALVDAHAPLDNTLELDAQDIGHACPCGFEPWVLVASPHARRCGKEVLAASNGVPGGSSSDTGSVRNNSSVNGSSSSSSKHARDEKPPLAVAAEAGRSELVCSNGHPMAQALVQSRASCDGCAQSLSAGSGLWCCRRCNFDVCNRCADAAQASCGDGLTVFLCDLAATHQTALVSWPRSHPQGCCGLDESSSRRDGGMVFALLTPLPLLGRALLRRLTHEDYKNAPLLRADESLTSDHTLGAWAAVADAAAALPPLLLEPAFPWPAWEPDIAAAAAAATMGEALDVADGKIDGETDSEGRPQLLAAELLAAQWLIADSEAELAALEHELGHQLSDQQQRQCHTGGFAGHAEAQRAAAAAAAEVAAAAAAESAAATSASASAAAAAACALEPSADDAASVEALGLWFARLCGSCELSGRPRPEEVVLVALPAAVEAAATLPAAAHAAATGPAEGSSEGPGDGLEDETASSAPRYFLVQLLQTQLRQRCAQLTAASAAMAKRQKRARKARSKDFKQSRKRSKNAAGGGSSSSSNGSSGGVAARVAGGESEVVAAAAEETVSALSGAGAVAAEAQAETAEALGVLLRQHCLALFLLLTLPAYASSDQDRGDSGHAAEALQAVTALVPRLAILLADPDRRRPSLISDPSSTSAANDDDDDDAAEQLADGVPYASADALLRFLCAIPLIRSSCPHLLAAVAVELCVDLSSDENGDPGKSSSDGAPRPAANCEQAAAASAPPPPPVLFSPTRLGWRLPTPEKPAEPTAAAAAAVAAAAAAAATSADAAAAAATAAAAAPAMSAFKAAAGAAKAKQSARFGRLNTAQTSKEVARPPPASSSRGRGHKAAAPRRAEGLSGGVGSISGRPPSKSGEPANKATAKPANPSSSSSSSSSSSFSSSSQAAETPSRQVLVSETPTKKLKPKAAHEKRPVMPTWHGGSP